MRDTILILEEGNRPYPKRPQCNMFVPQKSINGRHLATELCRQGMERNRRHLEEEEAREGKERALTAYGVPLYQVISFNYLGQVLPEEDDD